MNNYIIYHSHTMLSNATTNMDSVNSYKQYIDRAKELNMIAFGFSEHGSLLEWLHKKEYCEKNGIKYIHAVEAYVTENFNEKIRDNYHVVLIAKNYDGFKELNTLVSKSFNRSHAKIVDDVDRFYYQPRISYDELKNTSQNIIITTACLGGILGNQNNLHNDFISFLGENKDRCFLEIQHHLVDDQKTFNKYLYELSQQYGIRLIAGTDTHALNTESLDGRKILQKAKNTYFENEEGWDLSFKTYDELIELYKMQNAIPFDEAIIAIENTNLLYDIIEDFQVDKKYKYPLFSNNPREDVYKLSQKGIAERGLKNTKELQERINYEIDTYEHNGASNLLLLEYDVKKFARDNKIYYGDSRGSVSGSIVAYLLKITNVNSIKYKLNFERFMNKERVSLADIDTDWNPEQRELVKQYLYNNEKYHCCEIITFNTIALKGAIRDVGRALEIPLSEVDHICKNIEEDESYFREKYKLLFKYVDMLQGVIVSIGSHPAATVCSPITLYDNIGTITLSTNNHPVSCLNMKEIDSLNFVKLDLLGLDNIGIIAKTCELANIDLLTSDNVDDTDEKVWEHILISPLSIFQYESDYAHNYLKNVFRPEVLERIKKQNPNVSKIDLMSMANGAIRPAGESYRDSLANGEYKNNGHIALDNLLSNTLGYCVDADEYIQTINGVKKIKNMSPGEELVTLNGTNKVKSVFNNGYKEVWELELRNGRKIKTTLEHKILTQDGFKCLKDVSQDDSIAYFVGNDNKQTYNQNIIKILAYLIGDGILTSRRSIGFVNADKDVADYFHQLIENEYTDLTTHIFERKSRVNKLPLYYQYIKGNGRQIIGNDLYKFLVKQGLKYDSDDYTKRSGCHANNKFIPNFIFGLNNECMLAFLGAFYDTDGSIAKNKYIRFKTSSKQLAYDLQELGRMLGYIFTVTQNNETSYDITCDNFYVLFNQLKQYSILLSKIDSVGVNTKKYSFGYLPTSFVNAYMMDYLKVKNINLATFERMCGYRKASFMPIKQNRTKYTSKTKVMSMSKFIEYPNYIINNNILWIPVKKIQKQFITNVYDMEVENEHNYICNGIVVHNCVYQEQIIEFLHKFCGFTMGEADIVRRGFAKKTGTEAYIPQIKNGFIKTMQSEYGVDQSKAETIIVDFLKVIEDASAYLFSLNHALPYSYIGYICGYLRYYYPLEFLTVVLNINKDNKEKTAKVFEYLTGYTDIKIKPIKFRYSKAEYTPDKCSNVIYQGIASIKYCNEQVAEELFLLRNNSYSNFTDLLVDIKESTSVNNRQIVALIQLNFFIEFGQNKKLLQINELFNNRYNKNHKDDTKQNRIAEVLNYEESLENDSLSVKQQIQAEQEYLGYIQYKTGNKDDRTKLYIVDIQNLNNSKSPSFTLYSIGTGKIGVMKMQKKVYKELETPVVVGDIIKLKRYIDKPKAMYKGTDDKGKPIFDKHPTEKDFWIESLEIIN